MKVRVNQGHFKGVTGELEGIEKDRQYNKVAVIKTDDGKIIKQPIDWVEVIQAVGTIAKVLAWVFGLFKKKN